MGKGKGTLGDGRILDVLRTIKKTTVLKSREIAVAMTIATVTNK